MGRLITDIAETEITWLFKDAYYSSSANRYLYKWPNPSFPYMVTIPSDRINDTSGLRIDIRRWIERHITDTVIMKQVDKSYRFYYGTDKDHWRYSEQYYTMSNWWYTFSFEDEHSALAFKLRFSDLVKDMTDYHPDHPYHKKQEPKEI